RRIQWPAQLSSGSGKLPNPGCQKPCRTHRNRRTHPLPHPCPAGSGSTRPDRWQPADVLLQQRFQSLSLSRGTSNRTKFIRIERGTTYQPPIDIRHLEQRRSIGCLDAAAIHNLYTLGLLVIQGSQASTNHRVHVLRLLRRSGQTGADGPYRLIRHYTLSQAANPEGLQHGLQLPPDHISGLTSLILRAGFADTENGAQPAGQRRGKFTTDHLVGLTEQRTALGMTYENKFTSRITQLSRGDFTGQRARLGLKGGTLAGQPQWRTFQRLAALLQIQRRRCDQQVDFVRPLLLVQSHEQLINGLPSTVHFPISGDQRTTHA